MFNPTVLLAVIILLFGMCNKNSNEIAILPFQTQYNNTSKPNSLLFYYLQKQFKFKKTGERDFCCFIE